jgi:hypothetical protein
MVLYMFSVEMVDYKGKCYAKRFNDLETAKEFFNSQSNYWEYKVLKQNGPTIFDSKVLAVE